MGNTSGFREERQIVNGQIGKSNPSQKYIKPFPVGLLMFPILNSAVAANKKPPEKVICFRPFVGPCLPLQVLERPLAAFLIEATILILKAKFYIQECCQLGHETLISIEKESTC